MTEQHRAGAGCCECGDRPADTHLSGHGSLCDRCADAALAAVTGWPQLPQVPGPVVLTGPDGRTHRLRYRYFRAPTGISLCLVEDLGPAGQDGGYEFGVLGDHDADMTDLAAAVHAEAAAEIGSCYLEPDTLTGAPWSVADLETAGRFEFDPDGQAHGVVVDGRYLTWDEFGAALSSFEGWRFRLTIDDPLTDHRSDPW